MITRDDIHSAIKKNVIAFDLARLETDETNFHDAGLDSLDLASILLTLEEEHSLRIPDEVAGDMISVSSIIQFAASKES